MSRISDRIYKLEICEVYKKRADDTHRIGHCQAIYSLINGLLSRRISALRKKGRLVSRPHVEPRRPRAGPGPYLA